VPLLLLAYLGFVSVALPDGAHGVAWPHMSTEFGVPVSAVGFILLTGNTGYVLSSVAAGFAVGRLGVGRLLAASTALAAAALAGYALAPGLAAVVAAALLLGLGSGAIDAGLNAYVARHFGARHISWLHASYGGGATAGPLLMTGMIAAGLTWRWGYGSIAVAQVVLAVAFAATARAWVDTPTAVPVGAAPGPGPAPGGGPGTAPATRVDPPPAAVAPRPTGRETWALPGLWLGAATFVIQVGIEIGAALWAYLLLTEGRGMAAHLAGAAVSAYWASMFVGRLVAGAGTDRIGTHRVLTGGLTGMAAGAVLVALPAAGWVAVLGLVVLGLAAAPMYPLLTLTTAERVGDAHADRTIGVQVGASAVGATALPAAMGVLIERAGPGVLGPCLLVLAALLAVLYARSRVGSPRA
jgi:fucose permease